jgi:hypothetical protein
MFAQTFLSGGAVKRASFEPEEPRIDLDSLVESLDPGDSFVTSIVDLLVKYVSLYDQPNVLTYIQRTCRPPYSTQQS